MSKKWFMALLLCVLLALSGCRADQNEKLSQTEPNDTQNVAFFTTCVENGDGSAFAGNALNCAEVWNRWDIQKVYRFPTMILQSRSELESFLKQYKADLALETSVDGAPSFAELTDKMEDPYFADHALLIVYVKPGVVSGAAEVSSVDYDPTGLSGGTVVWIRGTGKTSSHTQSGHLLLIPVEKELLSDDPFVDAILRE